MQNETIKTLRKNNKLLKKLRLMLADSEDEEKIEKAVNKQMTENNMQCDIIKDAPYPINTENAIAISADFHTHKRFHEFYERLGSQCNGFMGIFDLIASMARALTQLEDKTDGIWEYQRFNLDWIEFTEFFVDYYILEALNTGSLPSIPEILEKVKTREC